MKQTMISRLLLVFVVTGIPGHDVGDLAADEREEFFEQHIRPSLIVHRYDCHANARGKSEGGLLLDDGELTQIKNSST